MDFIGDLIKGCSYLSLNVAMRRNTATSGGGGAVALGAGAQRSKVTANFSHTLGK